MTAPPDPAPDSRPARSDESLLRALGAGEPAAAAALYRRYEGRLRAVVRGHLSRRLAARVDADDVVQSVFRRFLTAAQDGRYTLPDGQELWGLLAAITVNRLRSAERYHRAAKRDVRRTVGLDADTPPPADEAGLAMAVEEVIDRLPEHHRDVARLRLDGYEVGEIAERLDRSKRTVERVLQETRGRLRTLLEMEAADDPDPG